MGRVKRSEEKPIIAPVRIHDGLRSAKLRSIQATPAMAETMIMAGGTWIALRKLRSIQATPATGNGRRPYSGLQ